MAHVPSVQPAHCVLLQLPAWVGIQELAQNSKMRARRAFTVKRGHLEEALGHGRAALVHEAVQAEGVIRVRTLLHDVERALRGRVQAHVAAGVVQGQIPLVVAAVDGHQLAKGYHSCRHY